MQKQLKNILSKTKKQALEFGLVPEKQKNLALRNLIEILQKNKRQITAANKKDLAKIDKNDPLYDRILLDEKRLDDICADIRNVIKLKDPVGEILEKFTNKAGLFLQKVRVPLGVIGLVYEGRPNVTIDAASLCIKSGNGVILRGSNSAYYSNLMLVKLIKQALKQAKLSIDLVNLLPRDRKLVKQLLTANEYIDVFIPRGGAPLIRMVRREATVPVIETGAGVCHTYVESSANLKKAADIVVNAKTQRPSVCNALDTLVIDQKIIKTFLPLLAEKLAKHQVEIRADAASYIVLKNIYPVPLLKKAASKDYGREFLSLKMSVKTVSSFREGIEHVSRHTSRHSEAIITNNKKYQAQFLKYIDAAAVYVNTSTRYTDGAQFGLGAEMGISTQKLHARGPMALREMTTYKWVVKSDYKARK